MQIIPLFSEKNGGVIGVGCAEVMCAERKDTQMTFGVMDKERFRSASLVDRSLCSLELVDRAAP